MNAIYKRMTPEELYKFMLQQPVGDIINFAASEGRSGVRYTDEQLEDPSFDKWSLEDWWFAVHLRYEGYDSEGVLIDYAGGGYMHTFDNHDVEENGEDIVVGEFFKQVEWYDQDTKLIVEISTEEQLYDCRFHVLLSDAEDTYTSEVWLELEDVTFAGSPEKILEQAYGNKEQQLSLGHWFDLVNGKEKPLYIKRVLYSHIETKRSY